MIEFIDRPCGWSPAAPSSMRELANGGAPAWHQYSTAKYLNGSDPKIVSVLLFAPSDLRIHVELLPNSLARRWEGIGLQFASETEVDCLDTRRVLNDSIELMLTVPPLMGTVAGLCRSLHLLRSVEDSDSSFSDPDLPFSVFVSCPPPTVQSRVERLAESIAHEALHLQLSLVETAVPLVVDSVDTVPIFSPWKGERRTTRGLLHGVYVFANLRCFWMRVAARSTSCSPWAAARVNEINLEMRQATHLAESPALTAIGRRFATSFLRDWLHE